MLSRGGGGRRIENMSKFAEKSDLFNILNIFELCKDCLIEKMKEE